MFPSLLSRIRRGRSLSQSRHMRGAILFIALCLSPASAQMGGIDTDRGDLGTGGKNTIQGNVFYSNGRRMDRRVKVKLRSMFGEQFRLSDDSGSFSFLRLKGATYTLVVEAGPEFEIATETVDIVETVRRPSDPGQTHTVQITLQPKQASTRKAVGTVDAATGGVPDEARQLYKEAMDSAAAGDNKKAMELLNSALKIHPNYMSALNELGLHYMRRKEFSKAAESLSQALKIAPEAFTPRLNYGILLIQMKDYKAAVMELERAVQKDSSSASAHFHFGKALVNVGNYDRAEKELRHSISIGGDDVIEAHRFLGAVYIETRKNALAVDQLEKYLALAPKAKDSDKIREIIKQLRAQSSNK
jgi:tetratricopeptide (TPR) repeat protein